MQEMIRIPSRFPPGEQDELEARMQVSHPAAPAVPRRTGQSEFLRCPLRQLSHAIQITSWCAESIQEKQLPCVSRALPRELH